MSRTGTKLALAFLMVFLARPFIPRAQEHGIEHAAVDCVLAESFPRLFIRHPHPKVAPETVRHITTPAAVEAVLLVKAANPRVIVEVAKKEDLLTTYRARLALVANPHASLAAARRYVQLLRSEDLKRLASSRDLNPEVAAYLKARYGERSGPLN